MRKTNNWKLKNYNGFSNYYTWNVMLYLNNEYNLYEGVQEWKNNVIKHCEGYKKSYDNLISFLGLNYCKTGDGVSYNNRNISRCEIIQDIFED